MRILVAADEYPWPARSGGRQRLHWVLRMLSERARVDLLVAKNNPPRDLSAPPPDVALNRVQVVAADIGDRSMPSRAWQWFGDTRPRRLVGQDWTTARALAREWSRDPYDLVWFSHSPIYLALADLLPSPHIVDLDNLESSMVRYRRSLRRSTVHGRSAARQLARARIDALDEARWRRLESRIADAAAITLVCSELDQRRLDRPRVRVLPNGYELPSDTDVPPCRSAPGSSPVLLFVGLLTYEPNRDAAAFFAREVLPLVRKQIPAVRFRVVGQHGPDAVRPLLGLPGVEVIGEVPDIETELANASVSVAPIRFGGGTRIKILEAFAHGLPVVSTTAGCEGLDVLDGRHLLVADRPEEMAAVCCQLLQQADLRRSISAEAHSLWESRYRWTALAPAVREVLTAAGAG